MAIADTTADGDLLHGIFAGQDGYLPVRSLLGHTSLVTVATTAYAIRKGDLGKWIVLAGRGPAVDVLAQAAEEDAAQLVLGRISQAGGEDLEEVLVAIGGGPAEAVAIGEAAVDGVIDGLLQLVDGRWKAELDGRIGGRLRGGDIRRIGGLRGGCRVRSRRRGRSGLLFRNRRRLGRWCRGRRCRGTGAR